MKRVRVLDLEKMRQIYTRTGYTLGYILVSSVYWPMLRRQGIREYDARWWNSRSWSEIKDVLPQNELSHDDNITYSLENLWWWVDCDDKRLTVKLGYERRRRTSKQKPVAFSLDWSSLLYCNYSTAATIHLTTALSEKGWHFRGHGNDDDDHPVFFPPTRLFRHSETRQLFQQRLQSHSIEVCCESISPYIDFLTLAAWLEVGAEVTLPLFLSKAIQDDGCVGISLCQED